MIQWLKSIFSLNPKTDYKQLVTDGAIILDVRSKGEYTTGHIPGSLNIAVETLSGNLGLLKDKHKTIITCCASGVRSGIAKNLLKAKGYTNVINGGNWFRLQQKLIA
jgi:phage shock protein E